MNHMRQSSFDRINVDLRQFREYERRRYPQAVRQRLTSRLVDWPLYVGGQPRHWWQGPWIHLAYFLAIVLVLVAAVLMAGGSFELRYP